MCHFVVVLLRGKAGEFQRDVLLTFVFQRGSITATWRAHRSPVGASCRFLLAFVEAGELQQSFGLLFPSVGPLWPHAGLTGVQLGHLVSFWAPFWRLGSSNKYVILIIVFLRGEAGEFQRYVILIFVFQHGSITAIWRAHGSPVGASCEFQLAFWEAGELQQDVISIFVFLCGAIVATCWAHRSPIGASCEFLGAL